MKPKQGDLVRVTVVKVSSFDQPIEVLREYEAIVTERYYLSESQAREGHPGEVVRVVNIETAEKETLREEWFNGKSWPLGRHKDHTTRITCKVIEDAK